MSKLLATRNAQFPLYAEFVFNFNDWAIDSVDGVKKTFGSTVLLADPAGSVTGLTAGTGMVLDCINMPLGAVITGGELLIETAFVGIGAGATLTLGIAGDTAQDAVSALEQDDYATALALWRQRFGKPPADQKEKARQVRFLQSRGFALNVVFRVLRDQGVAADDE